MNTNGHKICYLLSISAKTHLSNKIYIFHLLEFFYTLTNTMCYHSNKLNVHYLHYNSLSRSTTSSLSGKKKKINHPMNHHSKLNFLGQAHIKALHTETSTLPRLECGREIPMTEELAHMLRSGKVVALTLLQAKVSQIKDDGI